jgi:hypothetical protein
VTGPPLAGQLTRPGWTLPDGHRPAKPLRAWGGLCPDEAAVLADLQAAGHHLAPHSLHRLYTRLRAGADADYDHGGPLTFQRRRRAVTVDATVGERATNRAMRAQP